MSIEVQNLTITAFDADDDDAVDASFRIDAAARAHDVPDFPPHCRHRYRGGIRHPYPGVADNRFLALLEGVPVGSLYVELIVHPAHRRRGIGRALYREAGEVAQAGGRKRLMGDTVEQMAGGPDRDGAGAEFAAAMGGHRALCEIRRKLELSHVDDQALDRLLAKAYTRAEGYSLMRWRDWTPDEYVDDVAVLEGR